MQRKALGKGLNALIPESPETEVSTTLPSAGQVVELDLDSIVPNPLQPRSSVDDSKMIELANSIQEKGIIEPIIVRRSGEMFEIVAGERRFRACKRAGLKNVPAIVKDIPDNEMLEIALIENVQREDLNPIDEARGYTRLVEELGLTQEEVAQKVGKDRSSVANQMRLLSLPDEIVGAVSRGTLSAGHARALLSISNKEEQLSLAREIQTGRLSVRETERVARKKSRRKSAIKASFADSQLEWAEDQLRTYLGTKVNIAGKGKKGQIILEYYTPADLERLVELILSNGEATH